MPLQGTGKIEADQIAVEQRDIYLLTQQGDKAQANVERGGLGGLQVVHTGLTMFRYPYRRRNTSQ